MRFSEDIQIALRYAFFCNKPSSFGSPQNETTAGETANAVYSGNKLLQGPDLRHPHHARSIEVVVSRTTPITRPHISTVHPRCHRHDGHICGWLSRAFTRPPNPGQKIFFSKDDAYKQSGIESNISNPASFPTEDRKIFSAGSYRQCD